MAEFLHTWWQNQRTIRKHNSIQSLSLLSMQQHTQTRHVRSPYHDMFVFRAGPVKALGASSGNLAITCTSSSTTVPGNWQLLNAAYGVLEFLAHDPTAHEAADALTGTQRPTFCWTTRASSAVTCVFFRLSRVEQILLAILAFHPRPWHCTLHPRLTFCYTNTWQPFD